MKFSAPLLDRIAVRMLVGEQDAGQDYSASELRGMIKRAWKAQLSRGKWNNRLVPEEVMFNEQAAEILRKWLEEHPGLSYRRVANIKRVARTVQDMQDQESVVVDESSVSMALSLTDTIGIGTIAQL
jgi:predicted ATPase with chaperone activity